MYQESKNLKTNKQRSGNFFSDITKTQIFSGILAIAAFVISILSYLHSQGSFKIENRAYVYVQSIYPSNIYEPFFEIKFKNYGKTPAKEIKLSQVRIYSKEVSEIEPDLALDSADFALLVPEGELSNRIPSNMPYYTLAEQLGKVFIVGKIIYKDIFDKEHQTQFAGWLRAHGDNTFLRLQGSLNKSD